MTTEEKKVKTNSKDFTVSEVKKSKGDDFFADFNLDDLKMTMEEMLEAGVHFGH